MRQSVNQWATRLRDMVAHQEPKVEEEEIVKVAGGPDLRGLMSCRMLKVRNIRSMMTVTSSWKRRKTTLPHCRKIFMKIGKLKELAQEQFQG